MQTGDYVFVGFLILFAFGFCALLSFVYFRKKEARKNDAAWDLGCLDDMYYSFPDYKPLTDKGQNPIKEIWSTLKTAEQPTAYLRSLSNNWGTMTIECNSEDDLRKIIRQLPSSDAFCEVIFGPGRRFVYRKEDERYL